MHIVVSLCANAEQEQEDVSFVVLGKTANYRQSASGKHSLLNYHFFAEIFLKKGGKVHRAALITPGGKNELVFKGDESVLEVHGGRYKDEASLNQAFPDGNYIFSYRLSDNTLLNETVIINNSTSQSRIPAIVDITLLQDGRRVSPGRIDPDVDLLVGWSVFETGNADPNTIVDDLVFVVTGDCHGRKIDHSGGPFSGNEYLTYASSNYTILKSVLKPGESYQLFVEHADVDTSSYREIPEIATYAATTFLDIHTIGEQSRGRRKCSKIMPAMDGGQTDRPQKN
ncbi:MAG: hypothetical protein GKR93_07330 [Gammaproteobacteria bacterium]|nr:hypothetical protein [Gammaproteobacteria bacterium]